MEKMFEEVFKNCRHGSVKTNFKVQKKIKILNTKINQTKSSRNKYSDRNWIYG